MRVTVWSEEFTQGEQPWERELEALYEDKAAEVYPDGINAVIADGLRASLGERATIRTAGHDDPEHGLSEAQLAATDVLIWWSHNRSHLVDDAVVERICQRVHRGMGFIALHASLESKPFKRLMGTTCGFDRWRQSDDWEAVWNVNPTHEISRGLPAVFTIPQEEAYAEYFDIPQPDELVFISSFEGGEVCRSGACFARGNGRIFYFRPGHQEHPTYYQSEVQQVIANAVEWAYLEQTSLDAFYSLDWEDREGVRGWFGPHGDQRD